LETDVVVATMSAIETLRLCSVSSLLLLIQCGKQCDQIQRASPRLHAGEGAHWRSLGLSDWLDDIDQGKGLLNQYRARLLAHFDSLEQILGLYMVRRSDGHWTLDQLFFHDLKIDKVGHRRLFEKWLKNRMASADFGTSHQ